MNGSQATPENHSEKCGQLLRRHICLLCRFATVLREKRIDKSRGLERLQVLDALPHSHKLNWHTQLVHNADLQQAQREWIEMQTCCERGVTATGGSSSRAAAGPQEDASRGGWHGASGSRRISNGSRQPGLCAGTRLIVQAACFV